MAAGTDFHGDLLLHGLGLDLASARALDDGFDKFGVNPFFHFFLPKIAARFPLFVLMFAESGTLIADSFLFIVQENYIIFCRLNLGTSDPWMGARCLLDSGREASRSHQH
jgi:hypothetical protein